MSQPLHLSRRALFAALPVFAAGPKFARVFHYVAPDSVLLLVDFAFGSDRRGWALGGLSHRGSGFKGIQLATDDGGNTWTQSELKFIPESLFVLDDSLLWAVSDKGEIWFSAEAGRDWRKLSKKKEARKLHFLDAENGFLIGEKKTFMRSSDGGKTWRHVPEGAQAKGNSENLAYRLIAFWNNKVGIVMGSSETTTPERLPGWMEPERVGRRVTPKLMVSLETGDGGLSWSAQDASTFGQIHRSVVGSDGTGFMLVKYEKSFSYGGEVYSFYPTSKRKGEKLLRVKDADVHDILYLPGDGVYLACTERLGNLPVPTKVRILHSKDYVNWTDLAVDYRAAAQRVYLSATPSGKVFAALDQATILSLR
ncbi:YCF48-related protein [Bryobacter aggregatus]|uniref:YCF48-related protein n=1 Tax=Bryobacter aggregatus TaxID=360054 RepID=UPI0004E0D0AD|nr:YCF48-related protein [Bryobacter aggregatus]